MSQPSQSTIIQLLLDDLLVTRTRFGLSHHLRRLRDDGKSWDAVAEGITEAIGNDRIVVSRESVRRWYGELVEEVPA